MRDQDEARIIDSIARRAFTFATRMIWEANHRDDAEPGDPKVGGHPAGCSSCIHIMSALHLGVRQPQDLIAVKPHGSPNDHSLNYLLGFMHEMGGRQWMDPEVAKGAMSRLRKFSQDGEPVFQSYHAEKDPDGNIFFPSGSVGIPPVASIYTALAYRYAKDHGYDVPEDAHFWSLMGDSEFREGSLMEALPDAAERELGNVTWIVDYNRQNLDGTRIPNKRGLRGTDAVRMERVCAANGWDVIQVMHGGKRIKAFAQAGGEALRAALEDGFADFEYQSLLYARQGDVVRERLMNIDRKVEKALKGKTDEEVYTLFSDLGGHDVPILLDALRRSKLDPLNPTLIVAHTIKGWGLESYASPGNHSALAEEEEVNRLLENQGLSVSNPFEPFAEDTEEGKFLQERGAVLRDGQEAIWALKDRNRAYFDGLLQEGLPDNLGLNLKFLPEVHTQYVWGQLAAKLIRLGNEFQAEHPPASEQKKNKKRKQPAAKGVSGDEKRWGPAANLVLTMAPDVGTSTNINPAMDDRIYGPDDEDYEKELGMRDRRRPALTPHEDAWSRHIRFEIAEANCMSAVGAFGKMDEHIGVPLFPVMTVYDFFIKRAYDQLYYNLYWDSSFICVGTPSGVTLAPEGAQHSWKSDIAMPNVITWEPFYAIEMDWVLADSLRRHCLRDNKGRTGVIIRAVTRSFVQAEMMERLKDAPRFSGVEDEQILDTTRQDALQGGYYLVDHRGKPGYEPGENVVHIFSMGAMGSEALAASDRLLAEGIYANIIVVTCGDLLVGNLGHDNGYDHLVNGLGINGDLHLRPSNGATTAAANGAGNGSLRLDDAGDFVMAAGRRIPIVAVVDGEPGIVDNLGGIVGVKSETLGVRKASKSGRPSDVYKYQGIDGEGVYAACGRVLAATAVENIRLSSKLVARVEPAADVQADELWPPRA